MKNLELKKMTEAALKRNTMKGKQSKMITSCNSFGLVNPSLYTSMKMMIGFVQCWVRVRSTFHSDRNIKNSKINNTVFIFINNNSVRRYRGKMAQTTKSHWWGSEVHLSTSLTQWICDCIYIIYLFLHQCPETKVPSFVHQQEKVKGRSSRQSQMFLWAVEGATT